MKIKYCIISAFAVAVAFPPAIAHASSHVIVVEKTVGNQQVRARDADSPGTIKISGNLDKDLGRPTPGVGNAYSAVSGPGGIRLSNTYRTKTSSSDQLRYYDTQIFARYSDTIKLTGSHNGQQLMFHRKFQVAGGSSFAGESDHANSAYNFVYDVGVTGVQHNPLYSYNGGTQAYATGQHSAGPFERNYDDDLIWTNPAEYTQIVTVGEDVQFSIGLNFDVNFVVQREETASLVQNYSLNFDLGPSYFTIIENDRDTGIVFDLNSDRNFSFVSANGFDYFAAAGHGADAIGAVPEPTSWAAMVGGLGMVGGALRRARRKLAVAE